MRCPPTRARPGPKGLCDTATGATLLQGLIDAGVCQDDSSTDGDDEGLCDTATGATLLQGLIDAGVCMADAASGGQPITSDSTSGGSAPEFKVVIDSLPMNLPVGSSIVLYLEDDYQEPATIPASSVYFVAEPASAPTGNGARVYTIITPKIDTDAYFDADKDDISIRVFIPDMCTNATDACEGPNGPMRGQKLTMVVEDSSGIRNPTEAGSHSAAFAILRPTDSVPGPAE